MTRRRVALVACLALTGCTGTTGGQPLPADITTTVTTAAPAATKPVDRDPAAVAVALRGLDPCGVIDLDAARSGGATWAALLPTGPHSCLLMPSADYSPGDDGVKIFVGDAWSNLRRYHAAPVTIAGAKAYEYRNFAVSKQCEFTFPVSFTRAITFGYDVSGDLDTCRELRRLAESSVARLRNPDGIALDPVKRPFAAWDGCAFLARLLGPEAADHAYEPSGFDPLSGCQSNPPGPDIGPKLEVTYHQAPEVHQQARQIGDKVAEVRTLADGSCSLSWNQGASGVGDEWFAALMFTLNAADCDTAARLAEQAVRLAGSPPGDVSVAPQRPLLLGPDEPDTGAAGACADYGAFNGQEGCEPYRPVPVPRGTERIMAAADANLDVVCAVFTDSVAAHFGSTFQALTLGQHCIFVEPKHTLKIMVNVTSKYPPAAYGMPASQWPDRRKTDIAEKAAVTFWNETRSGFDIYLSPYDDINRRGHVHIQVEALPGRGDGSRVTARLERARTDTATKVIAEVARKHFAG